MARNYSSAWYYEHSFISTQYAMKMRGFSCVCLTFQGSPLITNADVSRYQWLVRCCGIEKKHSVFTNVN